ncbi:MAG: FMN-binding protein [Spirochaetia bacterium]|jgi:Na+-transporting NADH:ubiquinone oxidoreductase subunit C|nr:FMN-binding protein [Spirochaetia bacterium]
MKLKKESLGYVVVFTFIVCVAFVLLLSVANQVTLPQVKANQNYASHYAVLAAFGLADASTPKAEVENLFASKITELSTQAGPTSAASAAYSADIDGARYLAVRITNPGLWGPITAILAADPAAERILGFEVLEQQETPGLGGRIGEAWFAEQFRGEKVGPDGKVSVTQGSGKGDPDRENSKVDAVTGASRTSDFVQILVAKALTAVKEIGGSL